MSSNINIMLNSLFKKLNIQHLFRKCIISFDFLDIQKILAKNYVISVTNMNIKLNV